MLSMAWMGSDGPLVGGGVYGVVTSGDPRARSTIWGSDRETQGAAGAAMDCREQAPQARPVTGLCYATVASSGVTAD